MCQCSVFLPEVKLWQQQSKTRKSRQETFLVLSSFTRFLYFVPNILSRIVAIAFKSPNTSAGILHCKELLELRIPILKNLYDIRFLIKRPKPITINARATSSTVTQILQNLNDGENLNTETNNFDDITTVLKDKNQKKE